MIGTGDMNKQTGYFLLQLSATFLFLLATAIGLTINSTWLYHISIDQLHILRETSLSKSELMIVYHQLLNYLNFPWVTHLHLADFPMSETGLQHFVDVKQLFLVNYIVWLVTLGPTAYFLYQINREKMAWKLIRPFQIACLVPIGFACLMMIGFDRFFITFHELFFRNSDWQFNPVTDPIITVLPEAFFLYCFILFFILLESFLVIGYVYFRQQAVKKR